jgi:glycosyltransferase involved in cell wall biosynthesis
MKVAIIRGAFLNPFEIQNYYSLAKKYKLTCFSSKFPINSHIGLPLQKLWSLTDIPIPYKYQIFNRLFKDAHYLLGLENKLRNFDIVHVAETYYHYTYQAIRAKQKGIVKKVISTVWEVIPFNNETLPGRKNLKQIALKEIDHFIAVTTPAKKALLKEGVAESKISVIPMGVDIHRFKPGKVKRKKVTNILYIGRLVKEKGIEDLLNAYQVLKTEFKNLKLTLIGSGPLKNKCQRSRAIIKSIPYSQIHKEYQKADIFVLPTSGSSTWQEQFGMVAVEALATGLPIIISDTEVLREVCQGAALYFKPGDSLALTQKLHQLIINSKLRKELTKTARSLAFHHYDSRKIAAKIAKIYES